MRNFINDYNAVSSYHSQFICVPMLVVDATRSGIVIEYLAAKGQEIVRPAYYDITLNGKSVRDSESSEMLDIIFATRSYDIGSYYKIGSFGSEINQMFVTRNSLTVIYETYKATGEAAVRKLNSAFANLG